MPQEQEWWWKYLDGDVKTGEHWVPDDGESIESLIAEATRRGVEQGKREAWAEACFVISLVKMSQKDLEDVGVCPLQHLQEIMADKLSSLSKSPNEN